MRVNEPSRGQASGFTMVELLVSVAATVLLALFLQQVFSAMSAGVSVGKATSDIIQNAMVVERQVKEDLRNLTPPLAAGFGYLMIVQREYTDANYTNLRLTRDEAPAVPTVVRSDQLIFVRTAGDSRPTAPGSSDSFETGETDAAKARVWYGHVRLTGENGLAPGDPAQPGGPDNAPASRWVLGRQALYFDNNPNPNVTRYPGAGDAYEVFVNATLYPGWIVNPSHPLPAPNGVWNSGLSDIINLDYGDLTGGFVNDAVANNYPERFYKVGFAYERPWCNPAALEGTMMEAWQVAQAHTYMLGNVSDFIVEFAGKYDSSVANGTDPIDLTDASDAPLPPNQIRWYGVTDFDPTVKTNLPTPVAVGVPYSLPVIANAAALVYHSRENDTDPPTLPATADAVFIWGPLSNAGEPSPVPTIGKWPHMIRIRYRVHDANAKLADANGELGKYFEHVFRVKDVGNAINPGP